MSELAQPELPFDPIEDRRIELLLESGQINGFMAEAAQTGKWSDEITSRIQSTSADKHAYPSIPAATEVPKAKKHRIPARIGLEAGATSGRDKSRLIANEEFERAKAEGRADTPLSPESIEARSRARRIARAARVYNLWESMRDSPVNEQMAKMRAWEEKNPVK